MTTVVLTHRREAGLLDEVGELGSTPVQFEGLITVVAGTGVTHLRYRVRE
ncbi:hypothetical protein [Modestobacter marinus]|nr:hypothetical protein [Modestobacter marinus]